MNDMLSFSSHQLSSECRKTLSTLTSRLDCCLTPPLRADRAFKSLMKRSAPPALRRTETMEITIVFQPPPKNGYPIIVLSQWTCFVTWYS